MKLLKAFNAFRPTDASAHTIVGLCAKVPALREAARRRAFEALAYSLRALQGAEFEPAGNTVSP
jgi:hypothetical protein